MSSPLRQEQFDWNEDISARAHLLKPELRDFFTKGIELANDIGSVNGRLIEAGRKDLVIYAPAEMIDIKTPADINSLGISGFADRPPRLDVGNNFYLNFYIRNENYLPPIIGTPEIEGLRKGTFLPLHNIARPIQKPVIDRMLIDPELSQFTEDLMVGMNAANPRYQKQIYEQELFIAYTLASRLVCETDHGVKNPDGTVDPRYLVR